jgi:hypothetical protein
MACSKWMNQLPNLFQPVRLYRRHPYLVGGFIPCHSFHSCDLPSPISNSRPQLPVPSLNNEELCAMIHEFMPIGSYDQTESKHTTIHYSSLLILCKFKQ